MSKTVHETSFHVNGLVRFRHQAARRHAAPSREIGDVVAVKDHARMDRMPTIFDMLERAAVLAATVVFATSAGFGATAGPAADPQVSAPQAQVRVMPMGSSTVAGSTPGGFRVDLWQLLV